MGRKKIEDKEAEAQALVGFTIRIGNWYYTIKKIRWDIGEIQANVKEADGKDKGDTYLSISLLPWLKTKAKEWLKSNPPNTTIA